MSKVRLLTSEEMSSLPDEVCKTEATEFAKLLGLSVSDATYDHHFADYYLQDDKKSSLKPDNIDVTMFNNYNNFIGLRPVISLDLVPKEVIRKGIKNDEEMLEIEFGYFPQTILTEYEKLPEKEEPLDCSGYHYYEDNDICLSPIFKFADGVKYVTCSCDNPVYFGQKKLTIEAGTTIIVKVEPVTWYVDFENKICICKDALLPMDIIHIEDYLTKYFLDDLLKFETKTKHNEELMKKVLSIADEKDKSYPNEFFERIHLENNIKEKIDLPSIDQVEKIGFFDQYLAEPTDFARLLGYEKGYFLNDKNPQVAFARYNNESKTIPKYIRSCGIRPTLPYQLISKYISKSRLTNLGYEIIEFGKYPQSIVSFELNGKLENLYQQGKLIKTGNTYITDSVHVAMSNIPFTKREFEEYEYENERYIRVVAGSNGMNKVINEEIVKEDDYFWIKVEHVKWYVDKAKNLAVCIRVLASGVQFENQFIVFDFLKKYLAPNLIQYLGMKKEEVKNDLISLEATKTKEKEKLGLDDDSIKTFRSCIKKASKEEADELAKQILKHINNNYDTDDPFDEPYVTDLLLQGANIDEANLLEDCIIINDSEAIKLLIKAGADVNRIGKNGLTPLIQAVKLNNSEVVKLLLLMGADVNKRDKFYATALNYAYSMDNKVIFDLLIQNGAYINTFDIDNLTLKDMHNGKIDMSYLFGNVSEKGSNAEALELLNQAKQDLEKVKQEINVKKKVYHK